MLLDIAENTLNVKDNRVCVIAVYEGWSSFKIPDGLDLEDKSVVKEWFVRRETEKLHIVYQDGREVQIPAEIVRDTTDELVKSVIIGGDLEGYVHSPYSDDDGDDDGTAAP